jgi:hypothetical protein
MNFFYDNEYNGQPWVRDFNNNIQPFNEALSSIYVKYKDVNSTFFNELTSNSIKKFDCFYDSIFIQTQTGYIFEKYTVKNSKIETYDRINNFSAYESNYNSIDYWFDEISKKVYFFEFISTEDQFIPSLVSVDGIPYSAICFNFKFGVFDIKTNLLRETFRKKIIFWLENPLNLLTSNGIVENPNITYNSSTNLFNVSFIIKNDVNEIGIVSINLNKKEIKEINTFIPYGTVKEYGFEPIPYEPIPTIQCNNTITGDEGIYQYWIDFGQELGTCSIYYNSILIPDRFEVIWDSNVYDTGYVGSSNYDTQLLALGIPLSAINTGNPTTGNGVLSFNKNKANPTKALFRTFAPLDLTGWEVYVSCPTIAPTPTPTPTITPIPSTPIPTPQPTQTPTPTGSLPIVKSVYIAFN